MVDPVIKWSRSCQLHKLLFFLFICFSSRGHTSDIVEFLCPFGKTSRCFVWSGLSARHPHHQDVHTFYLIWSNDRCVGRNDLVTKFMQVLLHFVKIIYLYTTIWLDRLAQEYGIKDEELLQPFEQHSGNDMKSYLQSLVAHATEEYKASPALLQQLTKNPFHHCARYFIAALLH